MTSLAALSFLPDAVIFDMDGLLLDSERVIIACLAQAAGDFNRLYEFSKAGVSVAGEPFVARYLISDFGVKRGTLRREVTNFVVLAQRFNQEVVSPPAQ
mgnify:CR=1 FL=1